MNENVDLTKILKDCPKGTKLYSIIYGEVELDKIRKESEYPIILSRNDGSNFDVAADGKYLKEWDGDCTLFPSKDERDWSKFKVNKPKFDPKKLEPFDRVLVTDSESLVWKINIFSHIDNNKEHPYRCLVNLYKYCIPYNNKTKHLVGTTDEVPEYYRYWED